MKNLGVEYISEYSTHSMRKTKPLSFWLLYFLPLLIIQPHLCDLIILLNSTYNICFYFIFQTFDYFKSSTFKSSTFISSSST